MLQHVLPAPATHAFHYCHIRVSLLPRLPATAATPTSAACYCHTCYLLLPYSPPPPATSACCCRHICLLLLPHPPLATAISALATHRHARDSATNMTIWGAGSPPHQQQPMEQEYGGQLLLYTPHQICMHHALIIVKPMTMIPSP